LPDRFTAVRLASASIFGGAGGGEWRKGNPRAPNGFHEIKYDGFRMIALRRSDQH